MSRPRKLSRPDHPSPRLHTGSVLPRRFLFIFGLAITIVFILVLTLPQSDASTLDQLRASYQKSAKQAKQFFRDHDDLPSLYNPFAKGEEAERPPDQSGAQHRGIKWLEREQWLIPFSSAVTFDDERIVLPPLADRRAIYTYYDPAGKPSDVVGAETMLLLDWRRAWWAHGFRPVVLEKANAQDNERMWETLQRSHASTPVKAELERLLAWSQVGGGILSEYRVFPMTSQEDPFMASLRQATFPDEPTKLGLLSSGLAFADGKDLNEALELALADDDEIAKAKRVDEVPGLDVFQSSSQGTDSIAIYDLAVIKAKYKSVADKLTDSLAEGLAMLHNLISAHLQQTWQRQYTSGINVVKPDPEHMTALTSLAVHIAQVVLSCSTGNHLPDSCPPNRPKCKPCSEEKSMPLSLPESFPNNGNTFQIASIPHPLTFTSLSTSTDPGKLTPRFVRRKTPRDEWLHTVTASVVDSEKLGGSQRVIRLKGLVAGDSEAASALMFAAEREDPLDLEWLLGFELPATVHLEETRKVQADVHRASLSEEYDRNKKGAKDSTDKTIKSERLDQKRLEKQASMLTPSESDLSRERNLIKEASSYVNAKGPREKKIREMVEAWNLADLEAWKFIRAFNARKDKEREDYMREEGLAPGGTLKDSLT